MSEHTHNPIVTNQCFFLSFKSQSLQYCILFTTEFSILLLYYLKPFQLIFALFLKWLIKINLGSTELLIWKLDSFTFTKYNLSRQTYSMLFFNKINIGRTLTPDANTKVYFISYFSVSFHSAQHCFLTLPIFNVYFSFLLLLTCVW